MSSDGDMCKVTMSRLAHHLNSFFDAAAESAYWLLREIKPADPVILHESQGGGFTDALHQHITDFSQFHDRDLVVRLSDRHFLIIDLTLPLAAKAYHRDIIASRIDLISPWTQAQALFGTAIISEDEAIMALAVAIAARSSIDRLLEPFKALRLRSLAIEIRGRTPAHLFRIDLAYGGLATKNVGGLRSRIKNVFYASLLINSLVIGISSGLSFFLKNENAALQSEIRSLRASLSPQNDDATVTADPLRRMVHAKDTTWPIVEQLDTLSAFLPEDTFLDVIDLSNHTLRLEGQSKNAADLPRILAQSPRFTDIHFAAPTLKKDNSDRDLFELELTLVDRGGPKP